MPKEMIGKETKEKLKNLQGEHEIMQVHNYSLWEKIKRAPKLIWQYYRDYKQISFQKFCHQNRKHLIIICDPQTDQLMMAYKDIFTINKIKTTDGRNHKVVKKILRHSTFATNTDKFLVALAESMQLKIRDGNAFFQWVDASLFKISEKLGR